MFDVIFNSIDRNK